MTVIMLLASARTDDSARADKGPPRFSTCRQVAAASAHSGSTPVPAVQASRLLPDSRRWI